MSRPLSNPKLAILMRKKARQLADMGQIMINGFTLGDLCDYANSSQRDIHRYVTGEKNQPILESRIAAVFGISVSDLRRRLGLPARKDAKVVKITGRQNKYGAFIEARTRRNPVDRIDATGADAQQPIRSEIVHRLVPGGIGTDQSLKGDKQLSGLHQRREEVLHRGDAEEFIARAQEDQSMNGYKQLDRSNDMHFLPTLIAALITIESNGNPEAIGDGGRSVGILQIKSICVEDVNRIYGTSYVWPRDAKDPEKAKEICRLYLKHYLKFVPAPAPSDAARIWNGGPHGNMNRSTIDYWKRVQPYYARECTRRAQARMVARNGR